VLDPLPQADLSGVEVLILSGNADPFSNNTHLLGTWLQSQGARVEHHDLSAGHELTSEDKALTIRWMKKVERTKMAEIDISKEYHDASHGRYVGRIPGIEGEAEITFRVRGPDLISADHTEASETMRGTGAAASLVNYMIDDARRNNFKILPLCPYVRAQYRKHPDWADVMTVAPGETPEA
jgi:uncharacterized protein